MDGLGGSIMGTESAVDVETVAGRDNAAVVGGPLEARSIVVKPASKSEKNVYKS